MVLPIGEIIVTEEVEVLDTALLPTKTYKLDFERGRCAGIVDGLKAMEQAIFKVLNTLRYAHLIYSDEYGFENMIGYEELYVRADLPRRIKEALLQDERITSVENFHLDFEKDNVFVRFVCYTLYGDVEIYKEVADFVRT